MGILPSPLPPIACKNNGLAGLTLVVGWGPRADAHRCLALVKTPKVDRMWNRICGGKKGRWCSDILKISGNED